MSSKNRRFGQAYTTCSKKKSLISPVVMFRSLVPQFSSLPQLDIITLNKEWISGDNKIDWIICGGESGAKRRPFNPDWARRLRDQCQEAGVPFFMKQIDKVLPIPEDLMIREFPKL